MSKEEELAKIDAAIKVLKKRRKQLADTWPKKETIYLHRNEEDNCEIMEKYWPHDNKEDDDTEEAAENFYRTGYEVVVEIEIHKNGVAYAVALNGSKLEEKVVI